VLNFYVISPGNETPYALPITPETWVSVNIPLSSYVPPVNLADVFQFKVDGNGTVYFDNWYFWKEPVVPGSDATLSDLLVDGITVDGFTPATLSYVVELPLGTTEVPEVTAVTTDPLASHVVNNAAALPGTTEVVVTSENEANTKTYSIEFTVAGETPSSEYCETEVYHFGDVNTPSAIYLTITNFDAQSVFVEIESARESPVDDLILNVPAGVGLTGNDFSVPGKISNTMIWNDTPPAEFEMNVLWSFEDFGGNWQLSVAPITVPFEASCNVGGPAMVKFRVDMSQYVGEFTNAYVSGSFNGWSGEGDQLLDPDMDNIYEATLELENGAYEYKFTLDNWAVQEEFSGGEPCVVTIEGYNNRALEVSGNATLPVVCWNSCEACPEILYDVTLSVDMNNYLGSFGNAYVSGSFNGWCGNCNQLLDPDMDGVYETTLTIAPGSYEYKFTLDNWAAQEQFSGGEPCTIEAGGFVNRLLEVSESTVLPTVCWNLCGPCPEPVDVTFSVDMSQFGGSYTNVYVSGSLNGWCGECNQMLDPEMDMVYEVTLSLNPGAYEYKFTLDNWAQQEEFAGGEPCTITVGAFTNRFVEVSESEALPLVCWNSCAICPDYQAGWGGISSNVMPEAKIMLEDLFAPIADDMIILLGQTGVFWPSQSINTIGEWDTYQGYKVKFANGVNFEFSGAPLTDRTVTFEPGMFFVPVLSEGPASVNDVIVPHENTIEFMFDMSTNMVYWPEGGIVPGVTGALETLEPGFAYITRFTGTTTIDFGTVPGKSNSAPSHTNKMVNSTTWNDVSATGSQHIISVNTSSLQSGDFVGVFDAESTCTGLAQYKGASQMMPLIVFGNDITTTSKDGMSENEAMNFRIYRNGQEMEVNAVYDASIVDHDGLFVENGLSIINEFKMGATSISDQNASSFSIYPNPNNGRFTLVTGGDDMYNFVVVNMQGQQILTSETSGSTTIDLSDQPKGVYFIRLSNTTSTSIEKIVVE
ncbi:MAG: T9SS type A sorting domain-containing protein, partial [Bacteroidales bacterium]|nr:T9SS type A sorting domain-containing protein [Bacteroidales bacterium]